MTLTSEMGLLEFRHLTQKSECAKQTENQELNQPTTQTSNFLDQ